MYKNIQYLILCTKCFKYLIYTSITNFYFLVQTTNNNINFDKINHYKLELLLYKELNNNKIYL